MLYGTRKPVGSPVLRAFFARTRSSRATNVRSSELVALGLFSRKSPKSRSRRRAQPKAAKATAGVAVVGKMVSITRATAAVWYTLLASGARSSPRWLAARSNSKQCVTAKAASALLHDTSVGWYLVWVCGRVYVVVGWAMRWIKYTGMNRFRQSFSTGRSSRKSRVFLFEFFDWIRLSENSVEKSWVEKPFFDCVTKPDMGFINDLVLVACPMSRKVL